MVELSDLEREKFGRRETMVLAEHIEYYDKNQAGI